MVRAWWITSWGKLFFLSLTLMQFRVAAISSSRSCRQDLPSPSVSWLLNAAAVILFVGFFHCGLDLKMNFQFAALKILFFFFFPVTFLNLYVMHCTVHCKDTVPKIRNKYSQKRKGAAPVPIPTFIFQWAIYIFPRSVCLFCCRKIGRPIVAL